MNLRLRRYYSISIPSRWVSSLDLNWTGQGDPCDGISLLRLLFLLRPGVAGMQLTLPYGFRLVRIWG